MALLDDRHYPWNPHRLDLLLIEAVAAALILCHDEQSLAAALNEVMAMLASK